MEGALRQPLRGVSHRLPCRTEGGEAGNKGGKRRHRLAVFQKLGAVRGGCRRKGRRPQNSHRKGNTPRHGQDKGEARGLLCGKAEGHRQVPEAVLRLPEGGPRSGRPSKAFRGGKGKAGRGIRRKSRKSGRIRLKDKINI